MSEFRRLRSFVAVAEHLNFRRAADEVGVAQPSLSQQIRALEDELGFELFERNKRRVRLTKAGAEYLVGVRSGLAAFERLAQRARAARDGLRGSIAIGSTSMLLIEHMPRVVEAFRLAYPDVEVGFTIMRSPNLLEELRAGHIELAFSTQAPLDDLVHTEALWTFESRVVLPAQHALAADESISLSKLNGETLIIHPNRGGNGANGAVMALCREQAFLPGAIRELADLADLETLIGLVACGLGICILPAPYEPMIHSPRVVFKRIAHLQPNVHITACWYKENDSPLVRNFLDIAHRVDSGPTVAVASREYA